MPAARSSGTDFGWSKESSLTLGQRCSRRARVASSVQSATTTSTSGACSASDARQSSTYGRPFTDATTTESSAGATGSPQDVDVATCLSKCPDGVEGQDPRQHENRAKPVAPLRENAPQDAYGHE